MQLIIICDVKRIIIIITKNGVETRPMKLIKTQLKPKCTARIKEI